MGANKAISLKTLMSKPVFRSHVLDVDGLGDVELVEISQAEALLIQSEMADTDKADGEANLAFMTRRALRMMEG
ncbi:MAG: hypothetical protein JKY93_00470, partial [Gammaproteobacteria bacterium]|nr:hypothetical protein [Gammaproteobacteria bacterium]